MSVAFGELFAGIRAPASSSVRSPFFAVVPVPHHPRYFVGKDSDSLACVLVSTIDASNPPHPPIRLENLDANFAMRCRIRHKGESHRDSVYTVIRCRSSDREVVQYFLSVCEAVLDIIGDHPSNSQLANAVNQLAAIFEHIRKPSTRPLNGLFGELFLLLQSSDLGSALAAWRSSGSATFDFSQADVRLDIKASTRRRRVHTFSYDQCNPPSETLVLVASLFSEQSSGGTSLHDIIKTIEGRVSSHADLVFKLHRTVADTLGCDLTKGLAQQYDTHLAASSLAFFWMDDVPAIRGKLPDAVSNVHFQSDLTALHPVSVVELRDRSPVLDKLLPKVTPTENLA